MISNRLFHLIRDRHPIQYLDIHIHSHAVQMLESGRGRGGGPACSTCDQDNACMHARSWRVKMSGPESHRGFQTSNLPRISGKRFKVSHFCQPLSACSLKQAIHPELIQAEVRLPSINVANFQINSKIGDNLPATVTTVGP